MAREGVVGDADRTPYHLLLRVVATALHLHDPGLVGVADRERLTTADVAVLLDQLRHHLDGLAGRLGALQTEVHERTVVDLSLLVDHLVAAAIGGLADAELPLVDVADDVVRHGCLGDEAVALVGVVVDDLAHSALGVLACRIVAEFGEHAVVVGIVRAEHGTVGSGSLARDEVGAG